MCDTNFSVLVILFYITGQGGYFHINKRPFEYVKAAIERCGFIHDAKSSERLKMSASLKWLKVNTNVYRRKYMSKIDHIKALLT